MKNEISLERFSMKNENGRSMIEMLGVLAIVGVLSAGALAGYSKAMYQHKINQTITEVSKAVNNFIQIDAEKSWGTEEIYMVEDLKKYGIYPECKEIPFPSDFSNDNCCKLPIDCLWADLGFNYGLFSNGHLDILFNASDKVRACISFLSVGWENIISSDLYGNGGGITIASPQIGQIGLYSHHPENFYAGAKTKISMEDITNTCIAACQDKSWCNISLIFRGDL